jgi:outer membrane receptor protein involved in Fe transport
VKDKIELSLYTKIPFAAVLFTDEQNRGSGNIRSVGPWIQYKRNRRLWIAALSAGLIFSLPGGYAFAQLTSPPQTSTEIPGTKVNVISTTPLAGVDLDRETIAAPVQVGTAEDIDKSGALDLSNFLNRRITDVHINEMQGNPFQADVSYRGYTASPLLGTPQGLSVFMDGVRLNQPFGDVVSWDLIPRIAVSSVTLMPGSNPLYGLNTLGGALALETKNGRANKGGSLQALYGSNDREALELEYGGASAGGWNWYVAGNRLGEHGWRDDSSTDIRQAFGKLGWQNMKSDVGLSYSYSSNSLTGNALQDIQFLSRNYPSVYTKPDNTKNKASFVNLTGKHSFGEKYLLSGNIYYRHIRTGTLNGDVNVDSLDQSLYQPNASEQAALSNAGYIGFPTSGENASNAPFPFWRCIANVLLQDAPGEKCNGLVNRSNALQENFGLSGQLTAFGSIHSNKNQFTGGSAYDRSRVDFSQSTQLGYLNADRSITALNAYGDGVTGGSVDGVPFDTRVNLHGVINTWSLFGTDTFSIGNKWHLTASARYNRTTINNTDNINPGGGPGSLDGKNTFERLNPAAGVTFSPTESLNLYFGYSEGSRAATSIELGCADPDQPCKLPNAMAGDPPLEKVVTRTVESGIRSGTARALSWNASYFFAENNNDILFVTSTQSGFGYFKNFGQTRRQGVEIGLNSTIAKKITIGGGYTFLDATFQSAEVLNGAGNSSNDAGAGLDGTIDITSGDRLPLTPRHMLKTFIDYQALKKLSFGLDLVAVSSSLARGNENDQHQPDGTFYLGQGRAAGYGVVNAGAHYRLLPNLELVVQLTNLFNTRYDTAAQLGPTAFTSAGNFIARPFPPIGGEFPVTGSTFFAPGAPRMFSIATRVRF